MKPSNRDTYCFRTSRLLRLRFAEMPKRVLPTAAEYQNEPVRQPALRVIDLNAEASGEMLISWHVLDIICVYFPLECSTPFVVAIPSGSLSRRARRRGRSA